MDNLVPAPVVFPVARRVNLSEANKNPSESHEYTMDLVYEVLFLFSCIDELAGASRRE